MRVSRSPNGAGAVVVATSRLLFQRLEVREKRLQIVRRDRHYRHVVSGLDRLRVPDPAGEIAPRVLERAGSQGEAASEMREVRADTTKGVRAANGVTGRTCGFLEHGQPRGGRRVRRCRRAPALRLLPFR